MRCAISPNRRRRCAQGLERAGNRRAHHRAAEKRHVTLIWPREQSIQKKAVVYDDEERHYDTISAFNPLPRQRPSDRPRFTGWRRLFTLAKDPRFIRHCDLRGGRRWPGGSDALVLANTALQVSNLWAGRGSHSAGRAAVISPPPQEQQRDMAMMPRSKTSAPVAPGNAGTLARHANQAPERLGHGKGYEYAHDHPGHFVAAGLSRYGQALYIRPNTRGKENKEPGRKMAGRIYQGSKKTKP